MVSDFDIGNPKANVSISKSHLYSFGGPHSIYKKVYNPECPQNKDDGNMPGPGTYDYKLKTIGTEGKKYKFQGRSLNMSGKCLFKFTN